MTFRLVRLGALLSIVALVALYAVVRLNTRGRWLPSLPLKIGQWSVTEMPVNEEERNMLGNPKLNGFELANPLQERIFGRIVAVNSFDVFSPPSVFQYYAVTAEKAQPLEGGGKGLLQIYRQFGSDVRIAMLSWAQRPDGSVSLIGVPAGASHDPLARFNLGTQTVFQENRSCLIRLFIMIHPADPSGAQARRNLINAANDLRKALLGGKQPAPSAEGDLRISEGGKDSEYVSDKTATAENVPTNQLLSLKPGSTWDFESVVMQDDGAVKVSEKVIVGGPRVVAGQAGVDVSIFRSGKLWRREVYQQDSKGLRLLAFGDATATLIEISPPLDLVNYPVKEGADVYWKGTLSIRGRKLPTAGYSRVSARENIVSTAGRFAAYRLDSVFTVEGETPTHFPAIRWLAPGIGFVRRGYADDGKPAVAQLKRFTVK